MRKSWLGLAGAATLISALLTMPATMPAAQAVGTGPVVDNTSLLNGGKACTNSTPPAPLGYFAYILNAVGSDPNPDSVFSYDYTFDIWPTSDPAAQTELHTTEYSSGSLATQFVPSSVLVSNTTYSWRVQLTDANGTSPWSQTCTFGYDVTPPTTPVITSSNYPTMDQGVGPIGQLAQFTFDGHGDPNTAGFLWDWGSILPVPGCSYSGPLGQLQCPDTFAQPHTIRANAPGGTASFAGLPPTTFGGPQTLTIAALDVAGNMSQPVHYQIMVPYTPAIVTVHQQPICGNTATVSFAPYPGLTGVTSYSYSMESINGPVTGTVAAGADGTATVNVAVTPDNYAIQARSISANGFLSSDGYGSLDVNPQPGIQSDVYLNSGQPVGGPGVTGTFTLSPPSDGSWVSSYRYRFGDDGPFQTVAADQNGDTATVQFTPSHPGRQTLTVQSVNAEPPPSNSCLASYVFRVAAH
jgi:hypothetical protein